MTTDEMLKVQDVHDKLMVEIERLRETIKRADYYINRLEAVHRGHVVRDLDEACNAWKSYKLRIGDENSPHGEGG